MRTNTAHVLPPTKFFNLAKAAPQPVCQLADTLNRMEQAAAAGRQLSPAELALLKKTHARMGFFLIEQGGF